MLKTFNVYYELENARKNDPDFGIVCINSYDRQDAVDHATKKFWDENDGQDWMVNGCTLYSVTEDGVIHVHTIPTPDWEPQFFITNGEELTDAEAAAA